jgi:hypothetical protein
MFTAAIAALLGPPGIASAAVVLAGDLALVPQPPAVRLPVATRASVGSVSNLRIHCGTACPDVDLFAGECSLLAAPSALLGNGLPAGLDDSTTSLPTLTAASSTTRYDGIESEALFRADVAGVRHRLLSETASVVFKPVVAPSGQCLCAGSGVGSSSDMVRVIDGQSAAPSGAPAIAAALRIESWQALIEGNGAFLDATLSWDEQATSEGPAPVRSHSRTEAPVANHKAAAAAPAADKPNQGRARWAAHSSPTPWTWALGLLSVSSLAGVHFVRTRRQLQDGVIAE